MKIKEVNIIKYEKRCKKNCICKRIIEIVNRLKYDSLTGFYTRTYFDKILFPFICKEVIEKNWSVCFILADIDNLKYFNDKFGYEKGDEYIKKCASLIKENIKEFPNYKIRMGGDEFLVILFLKNGEEEKIEKIISKINYKKEIEGISVGYILFSYDKAKDLFKDKRENTLRIIMLMLHQCLKKEKSNKKFEYRKIE